MPKFATEEIKLTKEEAAEVASEEDLHKITWTDPEPTKPWYQSRKFGYIVLSLLTMLFGGTAGGVSFSSTELLTYSLGIAATGVGGHVVSDVMQQRRGTVRLKRRVPPQE